MEISRQSKAAVARTPHISAALQEERSVVYREALVHGRQLRLDRGVAAVMLEAPQDTFYFFRP